MSIFNTVRYLLFPKKVRAEIAKHIEINHEMATDDLARNFVLNYYLDNVFVPMYKCNTLHKVEHMELFGITYKKRKS